MENNGKVIKVVKIVLLFMTILPFMACSQNQNQDRNQDRNSSCVVQNGYLEMLGSTNQDEKAKAVLELHFLCIRCNNRLLSDKKNLVDIFKNIIENNSDYEFIYNATQYLGLVSNSDDNLIRYCEKLLNNKLDVKHSIGVFTFLSIKERGEALDAYITRVGVNDLDPFVLNHFADIKPLKDFHIKHNLAIWDAFIQWKPKRNQPLLENPFYEEIRRHGYGFSSIIMNNYINSKPDSEIIVPNRVVWLIGQQRSGWLVQALLASFNNNPNEVTAVALGCCMNPNESFLIEKYLKEKEIKLLFRYISDDSVLEMKNSKEIISYYKENASKFVEIASEKSKTYIEK